MGHAPFSDRLSARTPVLLHVVRHGEAGQGSWPLRADARLTPEGRTQAQGAASALRLLLPADQVWEICASDLPRSLETAEIIAAEVGGTLALDARLREFDFGWEGETLPDILHRLGSDRLKDFLRDPAATPLPGAEPFQQFWQRVEAALEAALRGARHGTSVIVAHDGVNRALGLLAGGFGPAAWPTITAWRHGEVRTLALREGQ